MRFHFGLSFSWRTLKKFLIPILIGLLAYFGFNGIYENAPLGFIKVNALVDTNSTFNVDIPDYDSNLENYSCGTENVKDFLHNFLDSTDFSSTYYDLFIGDKFDSEIVFYLIPKNNDNINNFYQYRGQINSYGVFYNYGYWNDNYSNARWYYLFYKSCSTDISSSNSWQSFLTALNTGTIGSTSADNVGQLSSNSSNQIPYFGGTETLSSYIYNGSSYNTTLWFYFSSRKLQYNATNSSLNSNYNSYKKLYLENNAITYNIGDEIPSYYDLYGSPSPDVPSFKSYQGSIETLYTNLSINDVSNYSLNIKFDIENADNTTYFIENTNFQYVCSGRVDHTDYYTYDTFPCTLSYSYTITNSTILYTFNNITTTQTLTNYDKFYVTIKSNYLDPNISSIISDFSYSYNYGDFFNFKYDGAIYETFHNLPLNFKMYLSSNNDTEESIVDFFDYKLFNYGINVEMTNNTNHTINGYGGGLGHAKLKSEGEWVDLGYYGTIVSNLFNYGLLIYQQNSALPYPAARLIFSSGIVVSFNNTNTNDFYIIDSQGTISSNSVDIPIISNTNSYDISYYLQKVETFINDLSVSNITFANYTQDFYNSMPTSIQTFIFVMFIIACMYIVYLLIKK